MGVDTLSCLNTSVPHSVSNVTQCVSVRDVHHSVGNNGAKSMRGYVVGITATTIDEIRLDTN